MLSPPPPPPHTHTHIHTLHYTHTHLPVLFKVIGYRAIPVVTHDNSLVYIPPQTGWRHHYTTRCEQGPRLVGLWRWHKTTPPNSDTDTPWSSNDHIIVLLFSHTLVTDVTVQYIRVVFVRIILCHKYTITTSVSGHIPVWRWRWRYNKPLLSAPSPLGSQRRHC